MRLTDPKDEAIAQLAAGLWYAAQCERVRQRAEQCVREYQQILPGSAAKPLAANLPALQASVGPMISQMASALLIGNVQRGSGPFARLLRGAQSRVAANAAAARHAQAIQAASSARHPHDAPASIIRQPLAPPRWLTKSAQAIPADTRRQLWNQPGLRLVLVPFARLPSHFTSTLPPDAPTPSRRGKNKPDMLRALSITNRDVEPIASIPRRRIDEIISAQTASFSQEQQAIFSITDEQLIGVICQLDLDLAGRLREDPTLRRHRLTQASRLHLRATCLSDYWRQVQSWIQNQLPQAKQLLSECVHM